MPNPDPRFRGEDEGDVIRLAPGVTVTGRVVEPGGEPIAGASLPPRDAVPGDGVAVIGTDAGPMAVVISWEVFFSRRVREGVREGGQAVLNPTNGSSYWLTQVQTQQIASSQLRAVESGRWLVQVSPTGFSAFVDPDGPFVVHTTMRCGNDNLMGRLPAPEPATAALFLLGAAALTAGAGRAVRIRRRRSA